MRGAWLSGAAALALTLGGAGTVLAQDEALDEDAGPVAPEDPAASDDPGAANEVDAPPADDTGGWSEAEAAEEPAPDASTPGSPSTIVVHVPSDADEDDEEDEEPERNPFDPHELPEDKLVHFGVFARGIFVPQYGQNFFVAGGNDALRPGAGAFFNYRQSDLNFIVEVWGASFFNTAAYRGINETPFEMEWVESELSVLFVNLAVMYSLQITSWLAFEIGGGLGLGGVFGGLWRTEAYPDPMAAAGWSPCARPGDPRGDFPDGAYCDRSASAGGEGSYQRLEGEPEPYNFSGGVPPLWFWVELPRVALRIKPIRQLQIRVEGSFAIYGFSFGGSLAVGF